MQSFSKCASLLASISNPLKRNLGLNQQSLVIILRETLASIGNPLKKNLDIVCKYKKEQKGGAYMRTYCLSVENLLLGCWFTQICWKCAMRTTTFESSNKSVYFENGTTLHLSFPSCKQQNQFETSKIHIRHVIFTLSCVKSRLMIMRLLVFPPLVHIHLIGF